MPLSQTTPSLLASGDVALPLFTPMAPLNMLTTTSTSVPSATANPSLSCQPLLSPPTAPSADQTITNWMSFLNNLQPGPLVLQHSPLLRPVTL